MMDSVVPAVLLAFKLLVFCTGMFFAIKWHYDREQTERKRDRRALLLAGGKVAAVFMLALLGVGLFTFVTSRMTGLDLTLP